ncbi:porin, partial [Ochrobactrum teleogrylli]|uniref:porin n=1 Tax=Ochrobactrum teleogrylli TaxID=2479765 RepID=UPI00384AD2B6
MNIKSLLLGSAAALVAASGAQAADAIVAPEPEAVEYVRVCDAYGAGYFYIPGTETCLRIHGYVRYDVAGGDDVYARTRFRDARGLGGVDEFEPVSCGSNMNHADEALGELVVSSS